MKLPPALLAIQSPEVRARLGVLDRVRLDACPPAERDALARDLAAREIHRARGRAAKRSGDRGEAWVHAELDVGVAAGRLAWWRPVGPVVRYVGRGGDVRPVVVGVGPCDIVGQTTTGTALVVEVKRGVWLWATEAQRGRRHDPALADHQRAQLDACARGRGIALVAVELDGLQRWLTWGRIPWRRDGSLRPQDIRDARLTLAAAMGDG